VALDKLQTMSGSSPQIGNLAGQQWNVAGVTPPGAFRKRNSDNNVCSTLTSNIMNTISIRLDMYSFMQIHVRRAIHEVMPMTILEFPDRPV